MKITAVLICALMSVVSTMGQEGGGVRRGAMEAVTRKLTYYEPTKAPTKYPTKAPTKYEPTKTPTYAPTVAKIEPTKMPAKELTKMPTKEPTVEPTVAPTAETPVPTHERESSCSVRTRHKLWNLESRC